MLSVTNIIYEQMSRRAKIATGVGAAGAAGLGGLYALGRYGEGEAPEGVVDTVKKGAGIVGQKASDAGSAVKNYLVNKDAPGEDAGYYDRSIGRLTTAGKVAAGAGAAGAGLGAYGLYRRGQKRR